MNWAEDKIKSKNYKNIEYYGAIETEFEDCTFENASFYWNIITETKFINCTFENCTFAGVSFYECDFVKCFFKNCKFTKSNVGTLCSAKNAFATDCYIDKQSLIDNPLTIQKNEDRNLLTTKYKNELYQTFETARPKLAVDDPKHCLSCEETQETHENIFNLKSLTVDHFNVCYMSISSLTGDAFKYYLPRLLELLLIGKDNKWDSFKRCLVSNLVPNKFENRFKHYNKAQIKLIIKVLELVYNKYNQEEQTWDYELEIMIDNDANKELLKYCKEALDFWKGK